MIRHDRGKTIRLGRRELLLSTAAASLWGAPLLRARRAEAQTPARAKKLCIFFTPNGLPAGRDPADPSKQVSRYGWWPQGSGTNFALTQCLKPLEDANLKSDIIVLRGLSLSPGHSSTSGNGHHHAFLQTLVSRQLAGDQTGGISLDRYAASTLPVKPGQAKALHLGIQSNAPVHSPTTIFHDGTNKPIYSENDPKKVFDRVLAGLTPGAESERLKAQRRSVLDAVKGELESMKRYVGRAELPRLDAHAQALREIEVQYVETAGTACGVTGSAALDFMAPASFPAVFRRQMDLGIAALACDRTNVVTFMPNTNGPLNWLDARATMGHHDLLHNVKPEAMSIKLDVTTKMNTWYAQQAAYLLSSMKKQQLLKEVLVLWINEFSDGGSHNQTDMPFVLAGPFPRLGRYETLPKGSLGGRVPTGSLLLTVLQLLGLPDKVFGDPAFCPGPIETLLA